MNRKFLVSVVVLFVLSMLLGFVVHGFLLGDDYQALAPQVFRAPADAEQYFPLMLLAHVLMSIGLVWSYQRGREDKPFLGQGVRFALAIGLVILPLYLIYFVVQPTPSALAIKQILLEGGSLVIKGVVVAWLNR